jgi:Uma2 family endonuclease
MGLEQWPIRRLTVEEAIRMVEAGILDEDEPVELLDGVLVEMTRQGPKHSSGVGRLADRLRRVYEGRALVREEKPILASAYSLPEPDISIVRGSYDDYAERHPTGADTLLVVKVALSSHAADRRKASIYAAAGVPAYWLIDLATRQLELRVMPRDGAYAITRVFGEDETVSLPELDLDWLVRDLLP